MLYAVNKDEKYRACSILRSCLCDVMSLPALHPGSKIQVPGPTRALRRIGFNLPSVFGFIGFNEILLSSQIF